MPSFAAPVGVDPVAVGNLAEVADAHPVDQHAVAAEQMHAPLGSVAEGDTGDLQIGAALQQKHLGAELFRLPALVFLGESGHELHGLAVDHAGSADLQPLGAIGVDQRLETLVVGGVGVGEQHGVVGKVELDASTQQQSAAEEAFTARQQNAPAAVCRGVVDGFLQSCGFDRDAVANGSEVADIVVARCGGLRAQPRGGYG
jgi:hypothetical protein